MEKSDNELIAEFMGIPVAMHGPVLYYSDADGYIDFSGGAEPYWPDRCWNDLMPVVDKIRVMWEHGYLFRCPYYHRIDNMKLYTPIQDVHKAVVDFIKWYNSQK